MLRARISIWWIAKEALRCGENERERLDKCQIQQEKSEQAEEREGKWENTGARRKGLKRKGAEA